MRINLILCRTILFFTIMKAIEIWNKFLADKQQMSEDEEFIFVRDGLDEWLLKYLQKFSLGEKAELLLVTSRSHPVVLDYIYFSDEPFFVASEKALLERKDTELILRYAHKFCFVQELHAFMVDISSEDVLLGYFLEERLSPDGEIRLIERHSQKLFKAYVAEYALSEEAEQHLIKQKNYDFFRIYVSEYTQIKPASLALLAKLHDEKLLDIFREFCLS